MPWTVSVSTTLLLGQCAPGPTLELRTQRCRGTSEWRRLSISPVWECAIQPRQTSCTAIPCDLLSAVAKYLRLTHGHLGLRTPPSRNQKTLTKNCRVNAKIISWIYSCRNRTPKKTTNLHCCFTLHTPIKQTNGSHKSVFSRTPRCARSIVLSCSFFRNQAF